MPTIAIDEQTAAWAETCRFIDRYGPGLRRMARDVADTQLGRSTGTADDLFSELCLWLYRKAVKHDPDRGSFGGYVWTWIRPALRQLARRRGGLVRVPSPAWDEAAPVAFTVQFPEVEDGESFDVEEERADCARDPERITAIRQAVAMLPPRHRTIIEHRFGMNGAPTLKRKQVAWMLGLSAQTVGELEEDALQHVHKCVRDLLRKERHARARQAAS
jgi:RNA polymerase sigma factor (sigma-70 family)